MKKILSEIKVRQEGGAYTETVIMIPFFIIVWASIYLVASRHLAHVENLVHSRGCAWSYAINACSKDKLPDEKCNTLSYGEGDSLDTNNEGLDSEGAEKKSGIVDFLKTWFTKIFDTVFGNFATVQEKRSFSRPSIIFGGGQGSVDDSHFLLCNEKNRDVWEVIISTICSLPGLESFIPECW